MLNSDGLLKNIIYLDEENPEIKPIIQGIMKSINTGEKAITFNIQQLQKSVKFILYCKNNTYFIRELHVNHKEAKEIEDKKSAKQAILLLMQACLESVDYQVDHTTHF